ncbi:hypothetical protein EYF80_027952 [Liparis tanakae]|uniref:Uncharacterized protein n=1 Tax=Liparis tanakae TaxID=230148 RepID=A0A4Z2H9A0_9TELE|nr:hypothetical protein EYF80_027952 [Liparis tanakae]
MKLEAVVVTVVWVEEEEYLRALARKVHITALQVVGSEGQLGRGRRHGPEETRQQRVHNSREHVDDEPRHIIFRATVHICAAAAAGPRRAACRARARAAPSPDVRPVAVSQHMVNPERRCEGEIPNKDKSHLETDVRLLVRLGRDREDITVEVDLKTKAEDTPIQLHTSLSPLAAANAVRAKNRKETKGRAQKKVVTIDLMSASIRETRREERRREIKTREEKETGKR